MTFDLESHSLVFLKHERFNHNLVKLTFYLIKFMFDLTYLNCYQIPPVIFFITRFKWHFFVEGKISKIKTFAECSFSYNVTFLHPGISSFKFQFFRHLYFRHIFTLHLNWRISKVHFKIYFMSYLHARNFL